MKLTLDRPRINQYPTSRIIDELRRVADFYKNRHFSRHEFDQVATYCKGSVVLARFGSWHAALDSAGLRLERVRKNMSRISDIELFSEMSRVWNLIGHRPSKDEWEQCSSRYSYTTYKTRFKGWVNACAAFIEHMSSGQHDATTFSPSENSEREPSIPLRIDTSDKRGIPMKLRYQVLARDKFKCVACGRSPATHAGVILHIDHDVPFSKNGKTVLENLRTLCNECNWGKGNENSIESKQSPNLVAPKIKI